MPLLPKIILMELMLVLVPLGIGLLSGSIIPALATAIILIIFSIIFYSKYLLHPIKELMLSVKSLQNGHFFESKYHSGDELGELVREFNESASKLHGFSQGTLQNSDLISAQRNKLALVVAAISDGVIALDLNHNVSIFNASAERILGYRAGEVLGQPLAKLIRVTESGHELPYEAYCPLKPAGFEGVIFSKPALDVYGKKPATVNLTAGQIADGSSVNIGCILTIHDIGGEKDLERMKLDFVSMAAHELRTPLTSIRGYLDVIYKEAPPKGEYFQFLEKAIVGTNQLFSLITNLLDVSRIEKGAMSTNLMPTNLAEIIQRVADNLRTTASGKNISLQFLQPSQTIPQVKGDKMKLEEVVNNLVANAINYTNPGGQITVSMELSGSDVVTHVKDNGKGIPKEAIPNLFTKFFRVTTAMEPGSQGTGLGLYISKSIVELHKGKIWVESEVDKGSTFSFSIPVQ